MTHRDALIDGVVAEFVDRRARGEQPRVEEYLARYPEIEAELAEHFDTLAWLDNLMRDAPGTTSGSRRIAGYVLIRQIGRGGMGTVFLAEAAQGGRPVALKLLGAPMAHTPTTIERFRREAEIARRLRHPNLVAVYDVGEHDGCPFLAMQLIEGATLAQIIRRMRDLAPTVAGMLDPQRAVRDLLLPHRLAEPVPAAAEPAAAQPGAVQRTGPFGVIARMIAEVADGLAHAHAKGVVHRDVKPHNILVDGALTPFLGDFGLAKDLNQTGLSRTGDLIGTPHYMSPEIVAANRVQVDHRTDIYSLGVTLYEALTLGLPFSGTSSHEVLSRILRQNPAPPRRLNPAVPAELQAIVLKAMAKDRRDRYATIADMAEDLRRFVRFAPVLAKPPNVGRILSRCAARHRGALLASGVLLLAAVAALLGSRVARARASARLLAEAERSLHAGDYPRAAATIEAARGTAWTPRHQAVRDEAFGVLPVQIHTVPAGASVQVRLVDAASGQVAEHGIDTRSGAEDGLVSLPLGIGAHAVTVSVPGLGYGEYLLEVARDQGMRRLDATIRPTGECIADMERVEGGIYRVGRDRVAGARRTPVLPEREVQVAPFWLDRSEVSRQQFVAFTRATGRPAPWAASDLAGDAGKLPVTGISWSEACAYAEWAGKRLPSEIEWEAAARGRNGMRYPWGDEFVAANAVLGPTFVVSPDAPTRIAAGRLPAAVDAVTADVSSCGCLHLIGNVREWTSTPWHVHDPSGGPQWLLPRNGQVVVKGSSYRQCCSDLACAASARTPFFRDERQDDLGFRCAKSDLR